ncbi:unnamed protein product, partial [Ectocarpus sp. 12 AP-2014]
GVLLGDALHYRSPACLSHHGPEAVFTPPSRNTEAEGCRANYASLNGSDKWTLQSIILLIFRMFLQDVSAMRRNMKTREIKDLVTEWGTYDKVLEALRELMKRA